MSQILLLFTDDAFMNRAGSHVSYPPPNRFMMAPVSILGGGADERTGAGELNTSAEGGGDGV